MSMEAARCSLSTDMMMDASEGTCGKQQAQQAEHTLEGQAPTIPCVPRPTTCALTRCMCWCSAGSMCMPVRLAGWGGA
jgi:hypothetical protein